MGTGFRAEQQPFLPWNNNNKNNKGGQLLGQLLNLIFEEETVRHKGHCQILFSRFPSCYSLELVPGDLIAYITFSFCAFLLFTSSFIHLLAPSFKVVPTSRALFNKLDSLYWKNQR